MSPNPGLIPQAALARREWVSRLQVALEALPADICANAWCCGSWRRCRIAILPALPAFRWAP